MLRLLLLFWLMPIILACQSPTETELIGQPGGPYRLTLTLDPPHPHVGQEVSLTYRITHTRTGHPLSGIQILHERALHTFIVSRDLATFAHTHHEDFFPLTPQDLATATFHFPHTFSRAGGYLIVSEFTYKDRSWIKHFTLTVEGEIQAGEAQPELGRHKRFGPYRIALQTSPDPPIAGYDTELVCYLAKQDGTPVTNLKLYLGTEVHMAAWRLDGAHFGHQHTYTPEMAALMVRMRDHTGDPNHMARMMVQLMRGPAQQIYTGPTLPVHHIFPEPGVYKLFFECAPGGNRLVADFMVEVVAYREGLDTTIHSIVPLQGSSGDPTS